ncbi:hypothetical protein SAY87_031548 [Trapa incisa]|uniref:Uncharacterized protein n=1 Tax=Trapa incisa TaxID=236973 RepID=A0AAN7QLR5_9MYRT|nr:hypothetical protein SAY87_031548 [Trapa incisa]
MKKLAAFIDSSLFPELAAPAFLIAIFVLLISFHFAANFITRRRYGRKKPGGGLQKMPPEAGGSWPLIGHLHLLDGPLPPHLVLGQMADKYGPLFTIRLGLRKAVVANNWEVAKECLTTNDRAFATRPKTVGLDRLSYDYAVVGFSPYGPYWRHIRKLSTIELLSNQRVELLRQVRESEVLASLRDICKEYHRKSTASTGATSLLVDMKRWFGDITMNTMYRIIVGKRINDSSGDYENEKKALKNWSELLGRFLVSDGLPFLRWLDLGGYEKAMKSVAKEIDQILQDWLDEHKARRHLDGEADRVNKDQDFMGVMLSILGADDAEIHSYDCDTINKATCLVPPPT